MTEAGWMSKFRKVQMYVATPNLPELIGHKFHFVPDDHLQELAGTIISAAADRDGVHLVVSAPKFLSASIDSILLTEHSERISAYTWRVDLKLKDFVRHALYIEGTKTIPGVLSLI